MTDETFHAVVKGVHVEHLGDALTATASIGATTLSVRDVADFDEEGGYLRLNGNVLEYLSVDDDLSTITLAVALAAAAAIDDKIEVWDNANGQPAVVHKAVVDQIDGFDGFATAVVSQSIAHALSQDMRDGAGESVTLTRDGAELRITEVHGRTFALAALQYLQGGMTTRQAEDDAGVDIIGDETGGTPGIFLYDTGGVLAMEITDDTAGGIIKFYTGLTTGAAAETGPGWINPDVITPLFTDFPILDIASPLNGTAPRSHIKMMAGEIDLTSATYITAGGLTVEAGGIDVQSGGVNVTGASDFQSAVTVHTADITITGVNNSINLSNPPTTTNAANARINNAGAGDIRLVTSLSMFKLEQEPVSVEAVRGILDLTPKTWFDRTEVEENDGSTEGLRRIPGLVAEDVEQHAPELALYDDDGALQGVAYDRLAALLIPIIREQQQQIDALAADLRATRKK